MKNIIILLLNLAITLSLAACNTPSTAENTTPTTPYATIEPSNNNSKVELDLDGITTFDDLESKIEEKLSIAIDNLNTRWNTLKSEVDTYEKYISITDQITEFYHTVITDTEQMCIMLYEYSAVYARMILDSDMSNEDKYNAVEEINEIIYEDACDEIYDEIYDGLLDEMYDTFYDGILNDAYENTEYSIWYDVCSEEYNQWYDTSSEIYNLVYDTSSDIYSFCYDLASVLYGNNTDRAEQKYNRFLLKIDRLKNPEIYSANSNAVFNTELRNAENTEKLENIVYEHVSECTQALYNEWKSLSNDIDTFDKYITNKETIEDFHTHIEDATSQILLMICDYSITYTQMILNSSSDEKYNDFEYFNDIFYDTACNIIKEEIYENLLKEIKDYYYNDIIYNAKNSVEYSIWSGARSENYSLWSDTRSEVYEQYSEFRSDLYSLYSDIRSELYSDDINEALDELLDFSENHSLSSSTIISSSDISEEISSSGIRPEFKQAMDSYEAFFDEYILFMNKYYDSDTDDMLAMMNDYTKYMTQYAETLEKLESVDTDELTAEEALYYTEVSNRIATKLLDAGI